MIEENEAFWRGMREAAGGDERILAAIRRCMKALGPPFTEIEAVLAEQRAAGRPLADFLRRRGAGEERKS